MPNLSKLMAYLLPSTVFVLTLSHLNPCLAAANESQAPNLVGSWTGENRTYSDKKGYSNWNKTVEISEQKGRLFKGQFTKKLFG